MPQKVLLTGANGFLGSHILLSLLKSGFHVRATVRSQTKATQVEKDFSTYAPQLETFVVPDITISGAFDLAVQSSPPITTVLHQASPFFFASITSTSELLDPAIRGTTSLLHSIKNFAPEVKRVIYTSSCAAVINWELPVSSTPQKVYAEEDWNPIKYTNALNGSKAEAYRASKKFAELAAWKFVEEEKPNFELVSLNPPMIWGPMVHTVNSISEVGESNRRIYESFFRGGELVQSGVHVFVDVRDLADAHVKAVTEEGVGGERIIVSKGSISNQGIADLLWGGIGELDGKTPKGKPGTSSLPENAYETSNEKAKRILGCQFRSDEETFVELGRQLLEIEARS